MNAITVEATLGLALSCARSFGEAVTRAACDAIAERMELEELASAPFMAPTTAATSAGTFGVTSGDTAGDASAAWGQPDDPARARLVFEQLAEIDPLRLSAADRVRFLQAAIAHTAWAESRVNAAMLAIAGIARRIHAVQLGVDGVRAERMEIEDAARSEIALAARWTETQAQARLQTVRLLHHLLPETASALSAGTISQVHATVVAEGAARLAVGAGIDVTHPATDRHGETWQQFADAASQLDHRASAIAARSTRSHTRAAVTRIVDGLDPVGWRARRAAAVATRDVWVQAEDDGNALLIARMRIVDAHACLTRIREKAQQLQETAAAAGEPDARRIGELRAQALTELILSGDRAQTSAGVDIAVVAARSGIATAHPRLPVQSPRVSADIQVVITLDALLGLQGIDGSGDTALLRGATGEDELVPAAEIRDLLVGGEAEVTLRRLVTDPLTGHLLDASSRRYRPSPRLRHFIETRDVRCRWPGCNARATSARTDLDHAVPFDDGGGTTRANLGVLCRRHHLLKTHEGFDLTASSDDGSCTFTTLSGETYRHAPNPVLPEDDPPPF